MWVETCVIFLVDMLLSRFFVTVVMNIDPGALKALFKRSFMVIRSDIGALVDPL